MGRLSTKTTVLNPEECGFTQVVVFGHSAYGYYPIHSEQLNIDNVYVIKDESVMAKDISLQSATSSIIGTVLFGVLGAILTSGQRKLADQWSVDIDIVLKEGDVIKIHSTDRMFIQGIIRFAKPIPIDPRQEMWKSQMEMENIAEAIRIEEERYYAERDLCDVYMLDYVSTLNKYGEKHKKTITARKRYLTTKKRINQIEEHILKLKNKLGVNV